MDAVICNPYSLGACWALDPQQPAPVLISSGGPSARGQLSATTIKRPTLLGWALSFLRNPHQAGLSAILRVLRLCAVAFEGAKFEPPSLSVLSPHFFACDRNTASRRWHRVLELVAHQLNRVSTAS